MGQMDQAHNANLKMENYSWDLFQYNTCMQVILWCIQETQDRVLTRLLAGVDIMMLYWAHSLKYESYVIKEYWIRYGNIHNICLGYYIATF